MMSKTKHKTWSIKYPDGTESLMTYDPIKHEQDKFKKFKEKESMIRKWHKFVVNGLVNGLSHTHRDGRLNDVDFWRKRCRLFDSFAHCILDLATDQDYQSSEKELKEIAKEGYKKEEICQ